jgi:hypothetical protein
MFGLQINSKGKRVLGRKTQRAASNHTTWASEGLSVRLTEVAFLEPKLTEMPVKSAFFSLRPGSRPTTRVALAIKIWASASASIVQPDNPRAA